MHYLDIQLNWKEYIAGIWYGFGRYSLMACGGTSEEVLKSLYVCLFTRYKKGEGSIREPAYPGYFLTKSLTSKSLKHNDISYSSYEVITGALAYLLARSCNRCDRGPPKGAWNHAFTQVFRTNHAQKLLEIHVHAKFTQSRWMPDWFFTQSRNYFHLIHVFTLWNMSNHAITLSPWGAPFYK